MLQKLGIFLISIILTNWLYSEAVLILPHAEPYLSRLALVFRIPTHNEWSGIIQSPRARILERELRTSSRVKLGRDITAPPLKQASHKAKQQKTYTDLFDNAQYKSEFTSGAGIFTTAEVQRSYGFNYETISFQGS